MSDNYAVERAMYSTEEKTTTITWKNKLFVLLSLRLKKNLFNHLSIVFRYNSVQLDKYVLRSFSSKLK